MAQMLESQRQTQRSGLTTPAAGNLKLKNKAFFKFVKSGNDRVGGTPKHGGNVKLRLKNDRKTHVKQASISEY